MSMGLSAHIDWAYTPLCIQMLNKKTEFNAEMDIRIFVESEVDYVINMMRNKFNEYKRTDLMAPFHIKAMETLVVLLTEQGLDATITKFKKLYKEITIENTLKLLLRCKLMFHARKFFLEIFEQILWYELASKETR